jgi:hypothetical protein
MSRSRAPRSSFWSQLSGWQQVLAAIVAAGAAIAAAVIPLVGQRVDDDGDNTEVKATKEEDVAREVKIVQVKRLAVSKGKTGVERWKITGTANGLQRDENVYILLVHTDANRAALEMSGAPGNADAELHGPADGSLTGDDASVKTWSVVITTHASTGGRGFKVEAVIMRDSCANCYVGSPEEPSEIPPTVRPSELPIKARSQAIDVG